MKSGPYRDCIYIITQKAAAVKGVRDKNSYIQKRLQMYIYTVFMYVFPVSTEHYWFATAYLLLTLLMPFLNAGFDRMEKKSIQIQMQELKIPYDYQIRKASATKRNVTLAFLLPVGRFRKETALSLYCILP